MDLQITVDWAFEWGYFSYKESSRAKVINGKVLRGIKWQADGFWRFSRVMALIDEKESPVDAGVSRACANKSCGNDDEECSRPVELDEAQDRLFC